MLVKFSAFGFTGARLAFFVLFRQVALKICRTWYNKLDLPLVLLRFCKRKGIATKIDNHSPAVCSSASKRLSLPNGLSPYGTQASPSS